MTLSYSQAAEEDLAQIARYTVLRWGSDQADRYLDRIQHCCETLVQNAMLGRVCDWLGPDLRRIEQGSHAVFYLAGGSSVLVVRVLHQRMLPTQHDFSAEADRT